MRRTWIIALAALSVSMTTACAGDRSTGVTPLPPPPATSPEPNTNGPCRDGTVLRPGEQCP